jgi:hypothetical protein
MSGNPIYEELEARDLRKYLGGLRGRVAIPILCYQTPGPKSGILASTSVPGSVRDIVSSPPN